MSKFSIRESLVNEDSIKAGLEFSQLVRAAIDCEFASQMAPEDLTYQLTQVAREVEAARGLKFSNIERMKHMQILAQELAQPVQQAA